MSSSNSSTSEAWRIHDTWASETPQFIVERGSLKENTHEVAAVVWDYALACVIRAVLNLQSRSE